MNEGYYICLVTTTVSQLQLNSVQQMLVINIHQWRFAAYKMAKRFFELRFIYDKGNLILLLNIFFESRSIANVIASFRQLLHFYCFNLCLSILSEFQLQCVSQHNMLYLCIIKLEKLIKISLFLIYNFIGMQLTSLN